MTIGTGGTNAATSLTALRAPGSFINPNGLAITGQGSPAGSVSFTETDADIATINQAIRDDFLPGASFTGSITTTVLTVSAVAGGALAVGMAITGAGVATGTVIISLGNGTGGTGTYNLNISQSVGSEAMNAGAPFPPSLGGFSRNGMLYVPNRGFLKVFPGDLVLVDPQGWPILVAARSIQLGPWTTTAT
jgi:hypothetical protein